jgi:hypothetical protein
MEYQHLMLSQTHLRMEIFAQGINMHNEQWGSLVAKAAGGGFSWYVRRQQQSKI